MPDMQFLRANFAAQPVSESGQVTFPSSLSLQDNERLRRHAASIDYSALLQKIRGQPGFQDFLQPSDPLAGIQATERSGPIVFINNSQYRCDAVVLGAKSVYTIALPAMKMEDLKHYALRMYQARFELGTPGGSGTACEAYEEAMRWLWTTAAKRILENIDFTEFSVAPSAKPRVTWVASGWLSLFPIHAAGDYRSGPTAPDSPCVCDHVVSSYIPSLLVYSHMQARSKSLKASNYPSEPLLVGMPRTPHLENVQDLNVGAELSAVRKSLSTQMSPDNATLISPSFADIAAKLKTCTVAHFACHGVADSQDPSKSALLLMDWKQKPLNVRALLRMTLQNCNLAFLSACESALNKDLGLRDEGIHIAGAFHMAGVPHTVATMWMVGDDIASEIAGLFYEGLGRKDGRVDWDTASQALHDAVQKLKRRGTLPILWGTFIHSGP